MRKNRFKLAAFFLLFPLGGFAREVRDATGARIELAEQPKRIIALAPSLGELASDICGENLSRIVGVSEYSDYPAALKKVASIGPYTHVSIEKIVSLHPDLVLATSDGNSKDEVRHLRELGIPVVVVSGESFSEVEDSIRLVGNAMGSAKTGEIMAKQLHDGLDRIRKRGEQRKAAGSRSVLLQLGDDPLVVAGRKSFLNAAVEAIGAINVYSESSVHYPRPSLEDVLKRDPDVILVLSLGGEPSVFYGYATRWSRFPRMKAVKQKRIEVLKGDSVLRPTLRLLEGMSMMEKAVYGSR